MLRRTLVICLVTFISFSLIPLSMIWDNDQQSNQPQVQHGIMDLAEWDYEHNQIITLDGEWEFYGNQLLTPEDFK